MPIHQRHSMRFRITEMWHAWWGLANGIFDAPPRSSTTDESHLVFDFCASLGSKNHCLLCVELTVHGKWTWIRFRFDLSVKWAFDLTRSNKMATTKNPYTFRLQSINSNAASDQVPYHTCIRNRSHRERGSGKTQNKKRPPKFDCSVCDVRSASSQSQSHHHTVQKCVNFGP